MVTYIILTVALLLPPAHANEEAGAAASAALALSKAKGVLECGKCRTDLEACRGEAIKTGKPLVVLVNTDCHATGKDLPAAIFVKVSEYTKDGIVADKPRIVLIKSGLEGTLKIEKSIEPMSGSDLKKELFTRTGVPA